MNKKKRSNEEEDTYCEGKRKGLMTLDYSY